LLKPDPSLAGPGMGPSCLELMGDLRQRWRSFLMLTLTVVVPSTWAGEPPQDAAFSISFTDNTNASGLFSGNVIVTPGKLSLTPFEYRVYYGTTGLGLTPHPKPLPLGGAIMTFTTLPVNVTGANQSFVSPLQGKCLSDVSNVSSPMVSCPTAISIPTGATHLLVRSHNQFGVLASSGKWTKIVDWTGAIPVTPAARPFLVDFTDTDQNTLSIGGIVNIIVKFPEPLDIASYRVYWYGRDGVVAPVMKGGLQTWAVDVPATGYSTTAIVTKGTGIPPSASRFWVVAVNREGQAWDIGETAGRATVIFDQGFKTSSGGDSMTTPIGIIVGGVAGLFILLLVIVKLRFVIVRVRYHKGPKSSGVKKKMADSNTMVKYKMQSGEEKPIIKWEVDQKSLDDVIRTQGIETADMELTKRIVAFSPGPTGMTLLNGGLVVDLETAGVAMLAGVEKGWLVLDVGSCSVEGQEKEAIEDVFAKAGASGEDYTVLFAIPAEVVEPQMDETPAPLQLEDAAPEEDVVVGEPDVHHGASELHLTHHHVEPEELALHHAEPEEQLTQHHVEPEEEAIADVGVEEQSPEPQDVFQDPPGVFAEGARAEYLNDTGRFFVPVAAMGAQEVLALPNRREPSNAPNEKAPICFRLASDESILEDPDPTRLRLPLRSGEPVEMFHKAARAHEKDEWVLGNIEGNQRRLGEYNVRLLKPPKTLLKKVPAHQLRAKLCAGDPVKVWVGGQWKPGKVMKASENKVGNLAGKPCGLVVSQDLVVVATTGLTIKNATARWASSLGSPWLDNNKAS